jgi:hypothetical protein
MVFGDGAFAKGAFFLHLSERRYNGFLYFLFYFSRQSRVLCCFRFVLICCIGLGRRYVFFQHCKFKKIKIRA